MAGVGAVTLAVLAVAGSLLAGCAQDAARAAEPGASPEAGAAASLPMPAWSLRDWWEYDAPAGPAVYVVSGETDTDWVVDTDSQERAFQDARDDISRLGPQRKSDLAGSQGTDRVEFFRWPLTAGASWGTTWDEAPLTISVLAVTPDGAEMEGRAANGTLVYTYRYDAQARWFGGIVRWNPDGSEQVRLTLSDSGRGWSGTAVRWQLQPAAHGAGPLPVHDLVKFAVGEGAHDIWARYEVVCDPAGVHSISMAPKEGGGRDDQGSCEGVDRDGVFLDAPEPGDWGLTFLAGPQGTYSYEVLVRTLVEVPVG